MREKWGPVELHPGAEMPPKHVGAASPAGRPSKEQLTDNLVTQASALEDVFSKMNEVSLSPQGKQLQYLLPMIKFEFSSENFGRLVSVMPRVLESFQHWKSFLMRSAGY